jgi:prevent-host-death family protein
MGKEHRNTWMLQDAKNQFSAVVDAALAGRPQRVSRRGKPAVVVLDANEYERLNRLDKHQQGSLAELLCDMPRDNGTFERRPFRTRDLSL